MEARRGRAQSPTKHADSHSGRPRRVFQKEKHKDKKRQKESMREGKRMVLVQNEHRANARKDSF